MTPEILVLPDAASLAAVAARHCAEIASAAVAARGSFHVALAGGETPRRAYVEIASRTDIDWNRCEIYWGDERRVPPNDAASNYGTARQALLDHVAVPDDRVHRMRADAEDIESAAREYAALLAARLGSPPGFDLVLLGLGDDGHTASLFPHAPALAETRRFVVAAAAPRFGPRLTLTLPAINAAREVIFLVSGGAKSAALRCALAAEGAVAETPARGVRPRSGRLRWIVDSDAFDGGTATMP